MEVSYKKFSTKENAMKTLVAALSLLLALMPTAALQAHEPTGDSFSLDGKVTSITLDERGGVITASAEAGLYGKVFLTYNVTFNASVPDQGISRVEEWVSTMRVSVPLVLGRASFDGKVISCSIP